MRRIRKIDTLPELRVRRAAHALGLRFRLHRRDLPGSPDLVFPRLRKAIGSTGASGTSIPAVGSLGNRNLGLIIGYLS
jgi:G:T-mismatch repair DNA endonuclease (very short patch repair protein)